MSFRKRDEDLYRDFGTGTTSFEEQLKMLQDALAKEHAIPLSLIQQPISHEPDIDDLRWRYTTNTTCTAGGIVLIPTTVFLTTVA